jgi:hypothetical protein
MSKATPIPPELLRTKQEIEEIVKVVRLELYNRDLPCGPPKIRQRLDVLCVEPLPSERTIARILAKHHLTHRRTGYYEEEQDLL